MRISAEQTPTLERAALRGAFRVGLVLQTGDAHMRGVSRGVYQFLRANPQWRIVGAGQYPLLQWNELRHWRGDGLIAMPQTERHLEALLEARAPVVNAASRFQHPEISTVAGDSGLTGTAAAEHLLGCRLRHFAFLGELCWEDEQRCCRAFCAAVAAAGYPSEVVKLPLHEHLAPDASARYRPDLERLARSLGGLPRPIGICVPNAVLGRIVVEVAHDCGLEVPDQAAVVCVSDDPLVCESTNPRLSAVIQPSERIGLEAAKQLDALMRGETRQATHLFLPPLGIAARRSTDMLAIEDPAVRQALRFIRDRASEPIEVADVTVASGVSRRTLETRFRRVLGRTPAVELRRVRIEIAKRLLAETNDAVTKIFHAAGFTSRQVFCTLFRKETGISPTAFRKRFQSQTLTPGL